MGKRAREEKEAIANAKLLNQDLPAFEKLRKESLQTDKHSRSSAETPASVLGNGVAIDGSKRLSKEERKEAKRVKNFHDACDAVRETEEVNAVNDTNGADEESKKAAAKSARKAERAVKKAAKRAKKGEVQTSSEASGIPTPTTASSEVDGNAPLQKAPRTPQHDGSNPASSGYVEDPALTALPQADIDSFLASNFITITDPLASSNTLRPITSFPFLPITDASQRAPFKSFSSPTPIQAAAWPFILTGRDVIGVAETGSGKTLAFGVPCIRYITSLPKSKKNQGLKAVMVSPTRELAMQIHEQIVRLATPAGLEAVCVYGGVSKEEQRTALKTASIVVATPGRLNDLIDEGYADLSNASYLVLDEADRMLDKGFEEEVKKIINTTPPTARRQTLMFTATWPESVRELAKTFMTSPVRISIGDNPTGELRANARITQRVEVVDPRGKETRLLQLIKQYQNGAQKDDRILIFCLYKKEATRVEGYLKSKNLRVAGIHGDLSQTQRTTSLDAFKSGKVPLLVATDVAARGLDIPAVKLVINFTFPLTVEDYVHRIGRTGRAGKDGIAITLFTEHDKAQSGALINVMKAANQPIPDELLKFGTTVKKKGHEAYGAFYKDVETSKPATKIKFDA
ncbi:MAG: RNA-dependent ATPase [Candelina submexicana]|nr:MAG: RNA-dependent ATPase [Candelina submexicana]